MLVFIFVHHRYLAALRHLFSLVPLAFWPGAATFFQQGAFTVFTTVLTATNKSAKKTFFSNTAQRY